MRRVALIVCGFVAGLCLGLVWNSSEANEARTTWRGGRPARHEPKARARESAKPAETKRAVPVHVPGPSAATREFPESDPSGRGFGWIEADCGGTSIDPYDVNVFGRTIYGKRGEAGESEIDGRRKRWRLKADRYEVEWKIQDEPIARSVLVTVRTGETTRVVVREEVRPLSAPVPPGLGRVEIFLYDLSFSRVGPAAIKLIGNGMQGEVEDRVFVNAQGVGAVHLRPGFYRLQAGLRVWRVEVREGEVVQVDLRPAGEGEVHTDTVFHTRANVFLVRADAKSAPAVVVRHPKGLRLLFVPPGDYRVLYQSATVTFPLRKFGRVRVRAGRVAQVLVPRGRLQFTVRAATIVAGGFPGQMKLVRLDGDASARPTVIRLGSWFDKKRGVMSSVGTESYLQPGLYRVEIDSDGYLPVRRDVEVHEKSIAVTIDLQPSR